jgi:hypothetical protein
MQSEVEKVNKNRKQRFIAGSTAADREADAAQLVRNEAHAFLGADGKVNMWMVRRLMKRMPGRTVTLNRAPLDSTGLSWTITALKVSLPHPGHYYLDDSQRDCEFDAQDARAFLCRVKCVWDGETKLFKIPEASADSLAQVVQKRMNPVRGSGAAAARSAAGGSGAAVQEGCRQGRRASILAAHLGEQYAKTLFGANWQTGVVLGVCAGWASEGKGSFLWNESTEAHSTFVSMVKWCEE